MADGSFLKTNENTQKENLIIYIYIIKTIYYPYTYISPFKITAICHLPSVFGGEIFLHKIISYLSLPSTAIKSRTMKEKPHYILLDGLRGVAALMVLVFHVFDVCSSNIIPHGYLAVDLFFVLPSCSRPSSGWQLRTIVPANPSNGFVAFWATFRTLSMPFTIPSCSSSSVVLASTASSSTRTLWPPNGPWQ